MVCVCGVSVFVCACVSARVWRVSGCVHVCGVSEWMCACGRRVSGCVRVWGKVSGCVV